MRSSPGRLVLRIVAGIFAAISAVVCVAAVVLIVLTNTTWGHAQVRRLALWAARGAVHGTVRIGTIQGDLLTHIVVTDFSITDSSGGPFLSVRRAAARYHLTDFLHERLAFSDVQLDAPVVVLAESQDSVWNYQRIFPPSKPSAEPSSGFGSDIALADVRLSNGDVTLRSPWRPDATLRGPARDSAIALATSPTSRAVVEPVPGGFEKVLAVHRLMVYAPLVRLADPTHKERTFRIAALGADLALFRPPHAVIEDFTGTLYLDADSLWFHEADVRLPASHVSGTGAYELASGDMHLALRADSVAFADARFAEPLLPDTGGLRANLVLTQAGGRQEYVVNNLALHSGLARVTGTVGLSISDSIAFHSTDLQFSGIDTRLIQRFAPTLEIPRRGTFTGHAAIAGPVPALMLDADITFDDSAAGASRVLARGGVGMGSGFRARQLTITLAPLQVALASPPAPSLPIAGTVSGQVTLDGSTETAMRGHADLVHRDAAALTHVVAAGDVSFVPSSPQRPVDRPRSVALQGAQGNASVSGSYSKREDGAFRPDRVQLSADFSPIDLSEVDKFLPVAELYGSAAGGIRITGNMDDLAVHARFGVVGAPDSSSLSVDGHIGLRDTAPRYNLAVAAHLFDAHAVSKAAPATTVTATMTAIGQGVHPATMTSALVAHVRTSEVDSIKVDTMALRIRVQDGQLHVDTAHLRALATILDADGTLGLDSVHSGTLSYRMVVDSLQAWRRFAPRDTTSVELRGAALTQAIEKARADSAHRADSTEIERAIRGTPPPTLVVDTPRALRRDLLAGSVVTTGTVGGNIRHFELRGALAGDSVAAVGNEARHAYVLYQWIGGPSVAAPIAAAVRLDSVVVGGFSLDSVDARVTYHQPDGTARLSLVEDSLHSYALDARFRNTPTIKQLQYDTLTLRFDTTLWRNPQPGTITWDTTGLRIEHVELVDNRDGHISIDGSLPKHDGAAGHVRVLLQHVDLGDIATLAQLAQPFGGELSTEAQVDGTLQQPRVEGTTTLSSANVRSVPLPDVFAKYAYDTTTFVGHLELAPQGSPTTPFARMDATVPIDLGLNATGSRLLDRPLHAQVQFDSLPLDAISQFETDVTNMGGRVSGQMTVEGTTHNPAPNGTVAMANGRATVAATGMAVDAVSGNIRLTPDSVIVDSLMARTPSTGGTLHLDATLDRTNRAVPVVSLDAAATDLRVLDTRDRGRLDVDGKLTVAGPTESPYIFGSTEVLGGVLYLAPASDKTIVDLSQPVVLHVVDTTRPAVRELLPASESLLSRLLMDVELTVNRGTWVRNEDANVDAHSDGPLTLHIDHEHKALVVNGTISTDVGEYRFFGKRFTISKGIATFVGAPGLNPTVNATGEYIAVPGANPLAINVNLTGTVDSLRISLSSNYTPPLSQTQLIQYLAFGTSTSGVTQASQSSSLTASSSGGALGAAGLFVESMLAAQAVGVLFNQVSGDLARAINADVLDINVANNYVDIAENRTNTVSTFFQNTQLEFGKYVTPRTYLSLQASVAPGASLIHRYGSGLSIQVSAEPLYLLGPPTLSTTVEDIPLTLIPGVNVIKVWKF